MNPAAEDVLGDVETASEQGADVLGGTIGGTQKNPCRGPPTQMLQLAWTNVESVINLELAF